MGHDQIFKDVLTRFFFESLQLFIPEVARAIDPGRITFLSTEVFTDIPEGARRTGDLLAQLETLDHQPAFVLWHNEIQVDETPDFPQRMWEYNALYSLRHGKPVISAAFLPFAMKGKVELVRYNETLFGQEYPRLAYWRLPLGALTAEEYLTAGPVLGAALAALMRPRSGDRVGWTRRANTCLSTSWRPILN